MATKSKTEAAPSTNKPAVVFRLRGVKVAVFENQADNGQKFYKVASPVKIYKDREEFKTVSSLGREDLPVARLLLQRCWEWILEAESNQSKEE